MTVEQVGQTLVSVVGAVLPVHHWQEMEAMALVGKAAAAVRLPALEVEFQGAVVVMAD